MKIIQIGLETVHEPAGLPVVTDLLTTDKALWIDALKSSTIDRRQVGRQGIASTSHGRHLWVIRPPCRTRIRARIKAGPVVGGLGDRRWSLCVYF
jgi:hypothetical protein